MSRKSIILSTLLIAATLFSGCEQTEPKENEGKAALSETAVELGKDSNYTLFASALAAANITNPAENYTVFTLPDSIIKIDGDAMPAADIQWHVVCGKYSSEELLKAQSLKTIDGQTLTVTTDTIEVDEGRQTVLYVNDVPVDYPSVRLLGETPTYPVGTNIAKISQASDSDNLDAYNSRLALALAGKWKLGKALHREYYIWSDGHRDDKPYIEYLDDEYTHKKCYEIFTRNPEKAAQGYAGTYTSVHTCGSTFKYSPSRNAQHINTGWWKVSENGISFDGGTNSWQKDSFSFDERNFDSNGKLKTKITQTTGRGDEWYYGGDELVIVGVYYETVYGLEKTH